MTDARSGSEDVWVSSQKKTERRLGIREDIKDGGGAVF